jgi:hypothetical protein
MSTPTFTVGDRVLISRVRGTMKNDVLSGSTEEGRVTKVGRTRVTVEYVDDRWNRSAQYRMDSGLEVGDFPGSRIDTPEQLADKTRRVDIVERLRAAGVRVSAVYGYGDVLSTDALAAILEIVLRDQRARS